MGSYKFRGGIGALILKLEGLGGGVYRLTAISVSIGFMFRASGVGFSGSGWQGRGFGVWGCCELGVRTHGVRDLDVYSPSLCKLACILEVVWQHSSRVSPIVTHILIPLYFEEPSLT